MDKIRGLLEALATGSVEVETVLSQLAVTSGLPASISPTPDVCVDLDRAARRGEPGVHRTQITLRLRASRRG